MHPKAVMLKSSLSAESTWDIEIVALAYRLDEMNGMQQYLPCLKMTPNSPAGMPRGDKPKLELEMCMRLTGTLPLSLSAA